MDMLKDYPLLRTDSYAKIFLYNTHETVACVPRHIIRMRDKVRPDKLQQAVERIQQETRRYAKRQLTWFRRDERYRFFLAEDFADRESMHRQMAQFAREQLQLS